MTDENVLEILKIISHPTRIEILRRINAHREDESVTCSCVLDGMDISQSTFSHHVSELVQVGLLSAKAQGRFNMLTINRELWDEFQKKLSSAIFG